jgi:hypothetical protein
VHTTVHTPAGMLANPPRRRAKLKDAAAYAEYCTKTLRRMGADGRLTLYRAPGSRLIFVDLNALDAVLDQPIPTTDAAGR